MNMGYPLFNLGMIPAKYSEENQGRVSEKGGTGYHITRFLRAQAMEVLSNTKKF
jgi:hypothetical protein